MTGATHAGLISAPTARARTVWLWSIALVVAAIAIMLPLLLRPAFGDVDDHQLFLIHARVASERWPAVLASYLAESGARFRPLYWVGQFGELAAWGLNPAGWYLDRALLFAGSLLLSVWAFRPLMPTWAAVLGTLVAFAGPQAEPWLRLGPQEAYAVPLTLAALGCVTGSHYRAGIVLAVLAALTKEIFVVSSLAVLAIAWHRGHRPWVGIAATGLIAVAIAWLTLTRQDVYVTSRFGALLSEPRYWWPWAIAIGFAVGWVASRIAARSRIAAVALVGVLVVVIEVQGAVASTVAAGWAERTNVWTAAMAELRGPVIVVADGPEEYEAVVAIRRFVPLGAASLELRPAQPSTPLDVALWAEMQTWADQGGAGYEPGVAGDCVAAMFAPGPSPCPTTVLVR